jgi:hypothetical protein
MLTPISLIKQISSLLDLVQYAQYELANCYQFLSSSYEDYKSFSNEYHIPFKPLPNYDQIQSSNSEEELSPWLIDFYRALRNSSKEEQHIFEKDADLAAGLLLKFSNDAIEIAHIGSTLKEDHELLMHHIIDKEHLDFFDLYSDLYIRISKEKEAGPSFVSAFHQLSNYIDTAGQTDFDYWKKRYEKHEVDLAASSQLKTKHTEALKKENKLTNSLDKILDFAECDSSTTQTFKSLVNKYLNQEDRSDTSNESELLYKEITSYFYDIYTSVFQVSLIEDTLPPIIKMFLYFGYVDENLCGMENAEFLYNNLDKIKSNPEHGIYTLYDWLQAIYQGNKEPSRNEFDIDFSGYLHELQITGSIDKKTEAKMKKDPASKVMYELSNMFPTVNKVTYGKVANFTPLLSEHNILRPLQDLLLPEADVYSSLKEITKIDHSAYCREVLYSDPSIGIQREFIQTEVLPDIILMPNCGTRGIMWQEIEGKRRSTPARLMLPLLSVNDVSSILLRLTGEFRWEMCKRVQGSRWNDVSEKSLTSVYFDYVQFYRKNSNLSPEIKTKIKLALGRVRNSFKEAFIQDYIAYMSYEKNGIPKLNKVSRSIFFEYCPFTKEYREKLGRNPLYTEALNSYVLHIKRDLHRYELIEKKFEANNQKLPDEIKRQIEFLNR